MISSSGSDDPASGRSSSGGSAPGLSAAGSAAVSERAPGRGAALRPALAVVTLIFLASSYFSIAVNSIALGAMFLLWAAAMVGDQSLRPARTILDYAFLAYVVADLLASAFSLDPSRSFINARRLLLIGIVYALASTLQDGRDQKRAVAVLLGAAGVVGAIGVVKVLLGWIDANQRLGVFQFYMTTAGVMMIAALLLIPFAVHPATPRRVRIWSIVALVPVLLSLYATVTRGAYLAVVAGAIAIAVIRNRRLLVPLAAVVALTIIFALIGSLAITLTVINPDQYMEAWGADAFRMYLMFLGPYEEGGDFRDQGISGVRRFLDRLWASVRDARTDVAIDANVTRQLHRTIKKVGEDTATLSYNTAIASMMECLNHVRSGDRPVHREEVLPLVQLVAAYAPHFAEECWELLGHTGSVFDGGWPTFDPALLVDNEVDLVVQVNGKVRGKLRVAVDVTQDAAMTAAMAPAIAAAMDRPRLPL